MGILAYVKNTFISGKSGLGSSVSLQEAPRGLQPINIDETIGVTQGGVDLASQKAVLEDVKYGGAASGVATRSFGGGTYILSVEATIPELKGVLYQVWLVGDGGIRSVDFMRGSGKSWSLTLRDVDKYSGYDGIWITLERTKEDNRPEEHVLEGTF